MLLEGEHQRSREVVPSRWTELTAEAHELRHVGRLMVDEDRRRADATDGVVNAGPAEREQAVREVVAGPASDSQNSRTSMLGPRPVYGAGVGSPVVPDVEKIALKTSVILGSRHSMPPYGSW